MTRDKSQGDSLCCCICRKQFKEHKLLHLHQEACSSSAASCISQFVPFSNGGSSGGKVGAAGDHQAKMVQHNHLNNFSGHFTRKQQRMFRAFARDKARHQERRQQLKWEWDDSRPLHAHWAPERSSRVSPEAHPSSCVVHEEFLKKLDLVTNSGADRLKHEAENHGEVDLDCQIVAVEGPITGEPLHSPRTTRSLISQLSRESAEAAKRRLSLCLDSEDASESEIFDSSAARRTTQGSLLAIDFSSPLGQRLKKHMKGDLVVPPITNIEQYCINRMQDERGAKLRHRANDYPIMNRKRKGIVTGYCHIFKFNNVERREYVKTLRTGLNTRSRRLLRLTKKCTVGLTRLRAEEIRRWTMRRRTIVNQEITIDDDISITQVDVPEDMFNTVQKMPVISHHSELYMQSLFEKKHKNAGQGGYSNTHCGAGASAHQHPSLPNPPPHPNHHAHASYPYPTSCVRSSSLGPIPKFLVKQVNKNWTENGQESQKLVYVPLEESGPLQHTNIPGTSLSARGPTGSSAQRPSKPSSSGIQKSLPRHLRPCPKSRRKQLLPEREDSSSEEVTVETASSSSDEDSKTCRSKQSDQQKSESQPDAVYPLSISRAAGHCPASPWMVADRPVPQMLHTTNSSSSATSVPVSSEPVPFPTDVVPVSLLPLPSQNSFGESAQQGPVGASEQVMPASSAAAVSDDCLGLRKQLSMFNLTPRATSFRPVSEKAEHKNRNVCGAKVNDDSLSQLSIGAVYSATDLSNKQLAASLGLECTQAPARKQVAALHQQPNFLQPDLRSRLDACPQDLQPCAGHPVQRSSKQQRLSQPDASQHDVVRQKYYPPQHLALPLTQLSKHLLHQQPPAKNSSGHHPSILRGPGRLQSPSSTTPRGPVPSKPPPLAPKSPPQGAKPSSAQVRSSNDWTVVRASDDDVVEVICIDDDD